MLTERVRWSIAFKIVVFMPMAISLFAAGVIWRARCTSRTPTGAINAAIGAVKDTFEPRRGALGRAARRRTSSTARRDGGLDAEDAARSRAARRCSGLTGDPAATSVPASAAQAVEARAAPGRDHRRRLAGLQARAAATPARSSTEELGLPGVTVELRDARRQPGRDARRREDDGTFALRRASAPGTYRVAIGAETFAEPFDGVTWLGPKLITPAIMIAYIWIWAGFAMVVIAARPGRDPARRARGGADRRRSEWQVFRRVTVPLLAPVLTVVFITLMINVLKVFDIVISSRPARSRTTRT